MIRFAEERDVADIMRLLKQVNNVHAKGRPDLFVAGATKYGEAGVRTLLEDEATIIFVNTDERDRLRGYCICEVHDYTKSGHLQPVRTLYIDDLCVDEQCRGEHVGTQLYDYVKVWARENGFYNITLNVWECNPGARAFYERMGLVAQKTTLETVL